MSSRAFFRLGLLLIGLLSVFGVGLGLGLTGSLWVQASGDLSEVGAVAAAAMDESAEAAPLASDPANWREEPILGLRFEPLTPALARAQGLSFESGALVREVAAGGLGERHGLRAGDVIRALNGLPVDDAHSLDALVLGLHTRGVLEFSVWRDGEAIEVVVDFTADPGVLG